MKLLILTGPAGAGKNTIAELAAKKREKCAVIDVDTIRWFLRNPHKAPWEGEEGKTQQFLGVKNACTLAENFLKENCDVIILDVINDETAKLYRELLKNPIGRKNPTISWRQKCLHARREFSQRKLRRNYFGCYKRRNRETLSRTAKKSDRKEKPNNFLASKMPARSPRIFSKKTAT